MAATCLILSIWLTCGLLADTQDRPDTPPWRLLRASQAEQIESLRSALDGGFSPDLYSRVSLVILNKSSLALPILRQKIEQVVNSSAPAECFTTRGVDHNRFVYYVAITIADVGDEYALKEIARLLDLDEARFGELVHSALRSARLRRNPFTVAYRAFKIGDSKLDDRMAAWLESELVDDPQERARAEAMAHRLGAELAPSPADKMKGLWAEAMLQEYGDPPSVKQWLSDPIASRLSPSLRDSLQSAIRQRCLEAARKRTKI